MSAVDSLTREQKAKTNENALYDTEDLTVSVNNPQLSETERSTVDQMLQNNADAFLDATGNLGKTHLTEYTIKLKGSAKPKKCKPYRTNPKMKQEIDKQIKELLRQGIIERSHSDWQSPVLLVTKGNKKSRKHMAKDIDSKKKYRMVIDYRYLNSQTVPSSLPIPRMDVTIDEVGHAKPKYFSCLDLASGFFQVGLSKECQHLTTFTTPDYKSYKLTRLSMGLQQSPSLFQELMMQVFAEYLGKFVLVYIDDIIVYSNSFDEHVEHLDCVFKALRAANLKLHPKKCALFKEEVHFLGMKLTKSGVQPSDEHVQAVKTYPVPKNVKSVRSFLGLVNFFRKFIPDAANVMRPLNDLTKKDALFDWTEECQVSFDTLKSTLIS